MYKKVPLQGQKGCDFLKYICTQVGDKDKIKLSHCVQGRQTCWVEV